ncbi:MAG: hypothetical protein EB060_09695, partial [Proteobacteria bacterium]|nr:hypothetical protein [Pseudomonadota bacterium]
IRDIDTCVASLDKMAEFVIGGDDGPDSLGDINDDLAALLKTESHERNDGEIDQLSQKLETLKQSLNDSKVSLLESHYNALTQKVSQMSQAIATAKRLGGVVSAFDVRPAVKEQVQSLGATFIEVPIEGGEGSGGYAKEMSEDYKRKQRELIAETLKSQDIVITTALIPGKPAPELVTEAMVKDMKPGSVIVDMAVERGGNCVLSERGKVVERYGVKIVGHDNIPSRIATDASQLYARNLFNFVSLLVDKETKGLKINLEDEIIKGCLVTYNGDIVHPIMQGTAPSVAKSIDLQQAPRKSAPSKAPPKTLMEQKPHLRQKSKNQRPGKKDN